MAEHIAYHNYLLRRSKVGSLYRKWVLYPRIGRYLKGEILDFGCGIGDFLRYRTNTVGIDINKGNIEHCKSLGLTVELLKQDMRIPFRNDSFSGIVIDNVIEHIPVEDVDMVINEVVRVLQPCGVILVGVPGIKGYHSDPDHKVFYSENNLIKLFDRHGFGVKKSFRMPLPWQFLEKYLSQYCVYVVFQGRE